MNELSENRVADDRDEPVENPMAARLYRSASGAARRAALVVGVLAVIAFAVTLPMTPARVAWLDVPLGAFVAWAVLAVLSRVVSRAHDLESRADAWARVIQPLALPLTHKQLLDKKPRAVHAMRHAHTEPNQTDPVGAHEHRLRLQAA